MWTWAVAYKVIGKVNPIVLLINKIKNRIQWQTQKRNFARRRLRMIRMFWCTRRSKLVIIIFPPRLEL